MIGRLVLRSFAAQPLRSAVLAGGFGTGMAAMAGLLGVGQVILDQSRAPALRGGGDVVISGLGGGVSPARFVLAHVLGVEPLAAAVAAAAPSTRARLYLVQGAEVVPLQARGSLPSRDRALGDPETAGVAAWGDAPGDEAWLAPPPESILRALDRFHPIPEARARADSWAEWLYFNGSAGPVRFYLTFLAGPQVRPGRRAIGVRLQLDRAGRVRTFADAGEIDEAELLATAPDLGCHASRVTLRGLRYEIRLDLQERGPGAGRVTGNIALEAQPGVALPPLEVRGTGGWVSGYAVPVLSGPTSGALRLDDETLSLAGGSGYHDHNWGFWDGVTWQWGQVAEGDVSIVYGRIRPPADVADPTRVPGFLAVLGGGRPLGFSTDVSIEERDAADRTPQSIQVRATGAALTLDLAFASGGLVRNPLGGGGFFGGRGEFLQLRGRYRVAGRVGSRDLTFEAAGAAETFRAAGPGR